MLPVVLYQLFLYPAGDEELGRFLEPVHEASALTHAHPVAKICCGLYALTIREWFLQENRSRNALEMAQCAFEKGKRYYASLGEEYRKEISREDLFPEPETLYM